ncbi:hypothetical protein KXR53_32595 [Inquilinus limosus]|uniref:hypothetical protein n=1 Tax=Inquilinus limosus TaxID=171674 RepID=UPI003F147DD4
MDTTEKGDFDRFRHYFLKGTDDDTPLLLPLAESGDDCRAIIRFCRQISRRATILAIDLDCRERGVPGHSGASDIAVIDHLARTIEGVLPTKGLDLVPVVVIGHASGADVAAQLIMRRNDFLAAAVLLRPLSSIVHAAADSLSGMHVLLACPGGGDTVGTAGWHVDGALTRGGARVVRERVLHRAKAGGADAVVVRVFLSTLFS